MLKLAVWLVGGFVAGASCDLCHFGSRKCVGQPLEDNVDWTTKGAVMPVRNNGQCGSCLAFRSTGSPRMYLVHCQWQQIALERAAARTATRSSACLSDRRAWVWSYLYNQVDWLTNGAHRTYVRTFRLQYMRALASACGSSNACRVLAPRLRRNIIYIFIHMYMYTYIYILFTLTLHTLTLIFWHFHLQFMLLLHLFLHLKLSALILARIFAASGPGIIGRHMAHIPRRHCPGHARCG